MIKKTLADELALNEGMVWGTAVLDVRFSTTAFDAKAVPKIKEAGLLTFTFGATPSRVAKDPMAFLSA